MSPAAAAPLWLCRTACLCLACAHLSLTLQEVPRQATPAPPFIFLQALGQSPDEALAQAVLLTPTAGPALGAGPAATGGNDSANSRSSGTGGVAGDPGAAAEAAAAAEAVARLRRGAPSGDCEGGSSSNAGQASGVACSRGVASPRATDPAAAASAAANAFAVFPSTHPRATLSLRAEAAAAAGVPRDQPEHRGNGSAAAPPTGRLPSPTHHPQHGSGGGGGAQHMVSQQQAQQQHGIHQYGRLSVEIPNASQLPSPTTSMMLVSCGALCDCHVGCANLSCESAL